MAGLREIVVGVTVVTLLTLAGALMARGTKTPLGRTLTPFFSVVGGAAKTADRMISRTLPVGDVDERQLGEALAARMRDYGVVEDSPAIPYLNTLIREVTGHRQRQFDYKVFVIQGPANAMALPGGVILVTTDLLKILGTEGQIVAVLAHETGHIELGHCFDATRFEMLSRKLGTSVPGELADFTYRTLTRHSFSKTQEQEADDYAFEAMLAMHYSPLEMVGAFEALHREEQQVPTNGQSSHLDPLRDYFSSHPPLSLRIDNYDARARRWFELHRGVKVYVGRRNWEERTARSQAAYDSEWIKN